MRVSPQRDDHFCNFLRSFLIAPITIAAVSSLIQPALADDTRKPEVSSDIQTIPLETDHPSPRIPNYVLNDATKTNANDIKIIRKLKTAIASENKPEALDLLDKLESSQKPKSLLEAVKIRFNKNLPYHDPLIAISLVNAIIGLDKSLKGDAAYLAGRHFQNSYSRAEKQMAIKWFEKAAAWGFSKAHVRLGDLYSKNTADLRNLGKALQHYQIAAATDSVAPLMAFARQVWRLNSEQEDCGIDPHRIARKYLPILKAEAMSGKSVAAKELGRIYLKGVFLERDYSAARKWLHIAAQSGDPGAIYDLARIDLKAPTRRATVGNATRLLSLAANGGNAAAYLSLGKLYLIKNTPETDEQAFELYRKAVNAGSLNAMDDLKDIYEGEKILGQNSKRVKRLQKMIQTIEDELRGSILISDAADTPDHVLATLNNPLIDPIVSGSIDTGNADSLPEIFTAKYGNYSCEISEHFKQNVERSTQD